MGQCQAAIQAYFDRHEQRKQKKIEEKLEAIADNLQKQKEVQAAKKEEYEGKVRGINTKIEQLKAVIRKQGINDARKQLWGQLILQRKRYETKQKYYLGAEQTYETRIGSIETLVTHSSTAEQQRQVAKGLLDLKKMGFHVDKIDQQIDASEDMEADTKEMTDRILESIKPQEMEEIDTADIEKEIEKELGGLTVDDTEEIEMEEAPEQDKVKPSVGVPVRLLPTNRDATKTDKDEAKLAAIVLAGL